MFKNRLFALSISACMLLTTPVFAEATEATTEAATEVTTEEAAEEAAVEVTTEAATEETTEAATEAETTTEETTEATTEEVNEYVLTLDDKEVVLTNSTGKKAVELYMKKAADEEWGADLLKPEEEADEEATTEETSEATTEETTEETTEAAVEAEKAPASNYDLKMVAEDNEVFLFYNLPLEEMEAVEAFVGEKGTYVVYTDKDQKEVSTEEFAVAGDETPVPVYTTSALNIRSLPSTDGKVLGGLQLAEEVTRYGVVSNGWCLIKRGAEYCYISGDYVTENKEEAEKILQDMKDAAAKAAQAVESKPSYDDDDDDSYSGNTSNNNNGGSSSNNNSSGNDDTPKEDAPVIETEPEPQPQPEPQPEPEPEPEDTYEQPQERYEVSRDTIPGCDDPDHGTIYITYSDGSVEVIDY